jgi:transposase-like protein
MNSQSRSATRIRRTAEQIQRLVAEFECSGQTIEEFAQRHGVAISTVGRWLRRHPQGQHPRLVEVKRAPAPGSSRIAALRLCRGMVLELDRGFEAEPIARLVQLLEGR